MSRKKGSPDFDPLIWGHTPQWDPQSAHGHPSGKPSEDGALRIQAAIWIEDLFDRPLKLHDPLPKLPAEPTQLIGPDPVLARNRPTGFQRLADGLVQSRLEVLHLLGSDALLRRIHGESGVEVAAPSMRHDFQVNAVFPGDLFQYADIRGKFRAGDSYVLPNTNLIYSPVSPRLGTL